MIRLLTIFVAIIITKRTDAITAEDATPGTRVRFHFTDKSRGKQSNQTIARIAEALDGRICVIMERAFYIDKSRVRIHAVGDPDLSLAVKLHHLQLVGPPPPPMSAELRIDLLIPRSNSFGENVYNSDIEQCLHYELPIANDAQYRMVLVNTREAVARSAIQINRFDIGTQKRAAVSWLLGEFSHFLDRVRSADYTIEDDKKFIADVLWRIMVNADWEFSIRGQIQDDSLSPFQKVMEQDIFHFMTPECRDMIKKHLLKIQEHGDRVDLDDFPEIFIGEFCSFFPFALRLHLKKVLPGFVIHLAEIASKLNVEAFQFYQKKFTQLQGMFRAEDSEYTKILGDMPNVLQGGQAERMAFVERQRDFFCRTTRAVDAMKYYFAVTRSLLQVKDVATIRKIGIVCPKEFVNGDWIRALSDIMQCDNHSVKMKMI